MPAECRWRQINALTEFDFGICQGGFAGKNHPSPELLVRWCQNVSAGELGSVESVLDSLLTVQVLQGAWHTRFTVHSWKEVSTTMWMYRDHPEVVQILRDTLAFRYRLAPTFYSLYVTHYHRRGWPVLKVGVFMLCVCHMRNCQ